MDAGPLVFDRHQRRLRRHHPFHHTLQRHRVAADAPALEEVAATVPRAFLHGNDVVCVGTGKPHAQLLDLHPVTFLRVDLCLLDFPDET